MECCYLEKVILGAKQPLSAPLVPHPLLLIVGKLQFQTSLKSLVSITVF